MKNIINHLFLLALLVVGCAPRGGDYRGSVSYPDPVAAVNARIAARNTNPVVVGNDPAVLEQYNRDIGRCNAVQVAQGKTAEEAIDTCAKSVPPAGVRVPTATSDDEGATSDVAPVPAPAALPLVDASASVAVFTGTLGNNKPSGCTDATCVFLSILPTVDHGRWMCKAISVRIDDREVYWLNGAGKIETVFVEPGEGFETLGGNRISIMPEGRSGYIRLGIVDDANGNRLPKRVKIGEHRATFDCWDLTQQTVLIGGVSKIARFATKIGTAVTDAADKIVTGAGGGSNPVAQRLPRPGKWH